MPFGLGQAMRGATGMGGGGGAMSSTMQRMQRPQGIGPSMGGQMGQRMGQQMQRPGMRMGQQQMPGPRPMPMPQVPVGNPAGTMSQQAPEQQQMLQNYRQQGQAAGNDMSWMDQPGAIQMGRGNTGIAGNMDRNRMQQMMQMRQGGGY